MKKGFTLVEVLAVIVIIGIISTIVGVSISGTIDVSKQKTYEQQVKAIEKAAQEWAIENTQYLSETSHYELSLNKLVESGKLVSIPDNPISGGKMNGKVIISYDAAYNQYVYTYNDSTSGNGGGNVKIENGTIVYFNPEEGKTCTNYTESQSYTGVKTGCMKWYAFNDNGSTVNLILDHNIIAKADMSSCNGNTATDLLSNATTTWKVKASLLNATDIGEPSSPSEMESNKWLFDRVSNNCVSDELCSNNAQGESTEGYWTNNIHGVDNLFAYAMISSGIDSKVICLSMSEGAPAIGVRPVITVSK